MRCNSAGSRAADHSASTPPGRSAVLEPLDAFVAVERFVAGARHQAGPSSMSSTSASQPSPAGGSMSRVRSDFDERRQIDRVQLHARILERVAVDPAKWRASHSTTARDDSTTSTRCHARRVEQRAQREAHAEAGEHDGDVVALTKRRQSQLDQLLLRAPRIGAHHAPPIDQHVERVAALHQLDLDAVLDAADR